MSAGESLFQVVVKAAISRQLCIYVSADFRFDVLRLIIPYAIVPFCTSGRLWSLCTFHSARKGAPEQIRQSNNHDDYENGNPLVTG